jgi:hypothetical protein
MGLLAEAATAPVLAAALPLASDATPTAAIAAIISARLSMSNRFLPPGMAIAPRLLR